MEPGQRSRGPHEPQAQSELTLENAIVLCGPFNAGGGQSGVRVGTERKKIPGRGTFSGLSIEGGPNRQSRFPKLVLTGVVVYESPLVALRVGVADRFV